MSTSTTKQNEKEVLENDLVSWLEEKLGHLKPYWTQIALGFCAIAAVIIAATFLWDRARQAEGDKWQALSYAQISYQRSLDPTALVDFADQFPDDTAGLWALLLAADADTRAGLAEFGTDRQAGFDKIGKAIAKYRRVVDSNAAKSTMLQRRSTFGLAYALESNGDFDEATEQYRKLADAGEETPFSDSVERALVRTKSDQFRKLFQQFRDYEADPEVAPGMKLPQRPDISFPGMDQPDSGGGVFGGTDAPAATEEAAPAGG